MSLSIETNSSNTALLLDTRLPLKYGYLTISHCKYLYSRKINLIRI